MKECKHSWIQDSPIKVCYHCGYKPHSSTIQELTNKDHLELHGIKEDTFKHPDMIPTPSSTIQECTCDYDGETGHEGNCAYVISTSKKPTPSSTIQEIEKILERKHPECFYKPTTFRITKMVITDQLYALFLKDRKRIAKMIEEVLKIWIKNHPDCHHEDEFGTERLWYVKNYISDLESTLLEELKGEE